MNSSDAAPPVDRPRFPGLIVAACLVPFILLATANSAGYRYGASDQAFYGPAVLEAISPELFPRDSDLIRSQARLTLVDDVMGPIGRVSGLELPTLFAWLQILTLTLLAVGLVLIGTRVYRSPWTIVALLAAATLRHAIIKSGTNTLEGYFHPRQLSFALGVLALAAFLRGRHAIVWMLLAAAGAFHPTTGLWIATWLAAATFVAEPGYRRLVAGGGAAAAAAVIWAVTAGPLAGRLVRMDPEWLATLSSKDYLFPLDWPVEAWLLNLAYAPIIYAVFRYRRASGLAAPREGALVAGCLALVPVFLCTVPFNAARVALAIQLQPARVFWMLDLLAIVYVVWLAAEGLHARARRARLVAVAIVLLSAIRGTYLMTVLFADRRIAQVRVPDDDWGRVMAWARSTDRGSGWIAAPDHASRYGTSVRVAAGRDVFVEAIKDSAVGMYERTIALRTRDRVQELGDFTTLTAAHARALASRYGLDYLVSEDSLDLPVAFSSGRLRVYRLRPAS
jgi:hypothetical protein